MEVANTAKETKDEVELGKQRQQEQEQEHINDGESLSQKLQRAVATTDSSPGVAVALFESLQRQVADLALFSSNELLSEISTGSLPFLALEHRLATALMGVPTGPSEILDRRGNVLRACDLWAAFLLRLEALEQLSAEEKAQSADLIELLSSSSMQNGDDSSMMPPVVSNRDAKIARFKAKQAAEKERERLRSLAARRSRLGVSEDEEVDGHDEESLSRSVALATLRICTADAFDEMSGAIRELPMIAMMARAQQDRQADRDGRYHGQGESESAGSRSDARQPPQSLPPNNTPMQLTHITQDAATGQLLVRREDLRGQVFQRGWNQPTMSLEELGDREMRDAMARDDRQKEAEAARGDDTPRRYDQVKKDGLEDNVDLVDASAALDRQWDDWKDENPRGSGNKRGDVGDRNF